MSTEESFNNSAQAAKDLKNVKQADMLTLYGLYKVGMTGAGPEGDRPWGVEGGMKYDAHSSASRKHNNSKLAAQNACVRARGVVWRYALVVGGGVLSEAPRRSAGERGGACADDDGALAAATTTPTTSDNRRADALASVIARLPP